MGMFKITWPTGAEEVYEQADCHDVDMVINTRFGGGHTVDNLSENGIKIEQLPEDHVMAQIENLGDLPAQADAEAKPDQDSAPDTSEGDS